MTPSSYIVLHFSTTHLLIIQYKMFKLLEYRTEGTAPPSSAAPDENKQSCEERIQFKLKDKVDRCLSLIRVVSSEQIEIMTAD